MSKWKWAAGTIGVAALGAFAALWALTQADVLRWGATAALHDRIEALERQAVEAPPPETPRWTVLSRQGPTPRAVGAGLVAEVCISYVSPFGERQRCEVLMASGSDTMSDYQRVLADCWETARIGDPLPDCWR